MKEIEKLFIKKKKKEILLGDSVLEVHHFLPFLGQRSCNYRSQNDLFCYLFFLLFFIIIFLSRIREKYKKEREGKEGRRE